MPMTRDEERIYGRLVELSRLFGANPEIRVHLRSDINLLYTKIKLLLRRMKY